MSKTIVVVGFGPGISSAVAEKFGAEGFSVVLMARNQDRLDQGVAALKAKGVRVAAIAADASNAEAIRTAVREAHDVFGPITVLHWNAYGGEAGDVLKADSDELSGIFDIAITGLVSAIQEVLPDMKGAPHSAILVTNGAFGENTPTMNGYAIGSNAMGLALANAAKHKLVGMLSQKLRADGVYVGQVTVAGAVKGTAWSMDSGIEPSDIAGKFWTLYQGRGEVYDRIG